MASVTNETFSLSNIAAIARSSIRYGALALVLFVVGRFSLTTAAALYLRLNPPPPPPPTMGFGLLPQPAFPTQIAADRPQKYDLQTVGKALPNLGDRRPVYFMPSALPDLIALDKAKTRASALGFVFPPEKVSTNTYRWRRSDPIPSSLEIDIVHNGMDLRVDWPSSTTLLDKKLLPSGNQLVSEVRSLLRSTDLNEPDIATASPKVTFQRALAGELRQAESLSDADFVRVDIWRVTPTGAPTLTAKYGHGVIRVLFSGSRDQGERILQLLSSYTPVSWDSAETYPLQSASLAFQALQSGQGYVTSGGQVGTAVIRSVYLAYYEPDVPQNYYQPVYVFEGDNDFQALVPALDSRVYQSQ